MFSSSFVFRLMFSWSLVMSRCKIVFVLWLLLFAVQAERRLYGVNAAAEVDP